MRKKLAIILISLFTVGVSLPALAESVDQVCQISLNADVKPLYQMMDKFTKYSNEHKLDEIKKFYAQNYLSSDNINKDNLLKIIKESWDNYPDMKYSSEIKDIRINSSFATVETIDKANSNMARRSEITKDNGVLESKSHNIVYLQKFGKEWKIISDRTLYEATSIKYGTAKKLNISFYAPEQVAAGLDYTATLTTEVPPATVILGSITKEPIVYPETEAKELFRQITPDTGILERVMKANTTNNNELASASVGFTEVTGVNYNNADAEANSL